MAHIKLTETYYIATDGIQTVRLIEHDDKPCVELFHKRKDFLPDYFHGEKATEAWANWKAYADQPKA
jgi:hypothetical protein